MYLSGADHGENGRYELGFITEALTAGAMLKGVFGIGRKKALLKQIDANAQGKWTSQFPPYADWDEFIDRPAPPIKKKGGENVASHRQGYEFWRKRKDSILIKNQIATPQDYGAYLVATYGLKDKWIDPGAKPGDALYANGPFALGTRIPIFDYAAVQKWAESEAARLQQSGAPIPSGPVNISQGVAAPAPIPLPPPPPGFIDRLATNYAATQNPLTAANLTASNALPENPASQPKVRAAAFPPLALFALAGVAMYLVSAQKGRK